LKSADTTAQILPIRSDIKYSFNFNIKTIKQIRGSGPNNFFKPYKRTQKHISGDYHIATKLCTSKSIQLDSTSEKNTNTKNWEPAAMCTSLYIQQSLQEHLLTRNYKQLTQVKAKNIMDNLQLSLKNATKENQNLLTQPVLTYFQRGLTSPLSKAYQKTSLLLFSLKSLKQSCPTTYSASQWLPFHTAGNQLKKHQAKGVTLFTLFGFNLTKGVHS